MGWKTQVAAVCAGAGVIVTGVAFLATADPVDPAIEQITPGEGYATLVVDLAAPLYSAPRVPADPDADPPVAEVPAAPLTADEFELRDDGMPIDVDVVTATKQTDTRYLLELEPRGEARVTPNRTTVVIPGTVLASGDPDAPTIGSALSRRIPLTGADAAARFDGVADEELELRAFGALPLVGSWFLNEQESRRSTDYSDEANQHVRDLAGPLPTDAAVEFEAQPRPLSDLLPGLSTALAGLGDPADLTQQDVVDALTAVAGIADVSFTDTTARLALDPAEAATNRTSRQVTDVSRLPFSLDAATTFALHLDGWLELDLTSLDDGAAALGGYDLRLQPEVEVPPLVEGARIGMVSVTPELTIDAAGLEARLWCEDGCTAALPSTTGTVTLTLDEVTYEAGSLGAVDVDLSDEATTLTAAWDTSRWDLADLVALADGVETDPPIDEQALLAALEATVDGTDLFDAAGLGQFDRLDTRSFVLGLEWLSTWLGSLDAVEGLGAKLPVVGMTVGDVLALADQVGREVADLVETIESARPDPAAPADPSAQDLVELLCASELMDCDADASSPWGYALDGLSITPDEITYDVEFNVCQVLFGAEGPCETGDSWQAPLIDVTEAGPSLDLALPDLLGDGDDAGPLGGMAVSLRAGSWRGTASASLAFRVSLDLRPDGEVMEDLDIGPVDFPTTGNPREDHLEPGDLCRGLPLAILPGHSPTSFAAVNGALEDAAFTDGCDLLAWTEGGAGFGQVLLPPPPVDLDAEEGTEPADPTPHTVTAEEVCRAAGYKHSVELGDFLAWNTFDGADLAAQLATCAARAYAHVTHDRDGSGDPPAPFTYEPDRSGEPLPVGFRIGIEQLDADTPLASAAVAVTGGSDPEGERFGGEARLGFLDLEFDGDVSATPEVELALAEPGQRLTLQDLADSADASTADGELAEGEDEGATTLLDLVDARLTGDLDVDLDLYNSIAFPRPSDGAKVRVRGDLAELTAGDLDLEAVTIATTCEGFDGVTTGVCYDLGDWTKLRELSPAQVLRMITGLLDRLAGVTGAGDASFELPVVGVSVQDLVAFNRKLNTIATTVEARDPEDLSSLQASVDAGLEAAGLPVGAVAVDITEGGVFTLALPLSFSETASYPFSFDVGLGEDGPLPIRIAPADGGARISATGTASFTPTLGFDLDAPLDTPLDERIFLVTDTDTDPRIGGSFQAEVAGAVTLGPLGVDLTADAGGDPSLTIRLSQLGSGGKVTLDDLTEALEDGPGDGFLEWGGGFAVNGSVAAPGGPFELGWKAELSELLSGEWGSFDPDPSDWEIGQIRLDLGTLVSGVSQTSRFVGRALDRSDALSSVSLPLVGDELAKLSAVGADLQRFARTVDDVWEQVEQADAEFVELINSRLEQDVCVPLRAASVAGGCTAQLRLFDGDGTVETVTSADRVELALDLDLEYARDLGNPMLIDVPGFALDTQAELSVAAGYKLGLRLGLDIEDGFYVEGFELDGTDHSRLVELHARAGYGQNAGDDEVDGASVGIQSTDPGRPGMKVAGVTVFTLEDLQLALSGTLGPNGDSAGFALDIPSRLTLADLTSRRRTVDSIFTPRISVATNATIVVQTPDDLSDLMPVLKFPVHFDWALEGVIEKGLEFPQPYLGIGKDSEGSYVAIDASGILDGVVRPTLTELNAYNPMAKAKPVRDALNTEIPVLEQNVRSMLELGLGREPAWQLFTFLLDMADVGDSIAGLNGSTGFIDLGGYQLLPRDANAGFFGPLSEDGIWGLKDQVPEIALVETLVSRLSQMAGGGSFSPPKMTTPRDPFEGGVDLGGSSEFSATPTKPKGMSLGQVVSFPILDDPLSAATLLFGGEVAPVSFIEIAPPAVDFGYNVKFSRTLFDLNVGFLEAKLAVGLEGAVGVVLRVGFGYSSHGLTSGSPVNGLYLVDAYDGHRDLPFVALGGRVGASVDGRFAVAGIAEATFRGSGYVRLEGGLDLFDESLAIPASGRGDGKFHLDEIAKVVTSHRIGGGGTAPSIGDALCIFRPVVQLDAGLSFGGTAKVAGVKVWSGSWDGHWDLIDASTSCPLAYRLAHLDGRRLILNAGPYAHERFDRRGDIAEGFSLTSVTHRGEPHIEVRGTGLLSDTVAYAPMRFPVAAVEEIYADLGAGNDTIDISTAITTPAIVYGGAGNDTIKGGGGDDLLDGGTGVVTIEARAGDNEIVVGAGGENAGIDLTDERNELGACGGGACSTVVLGSGDDTVFGGPAPVVYQPPTGGPFGDNAIVHEGVERSGEEDASPVATAVLDLRPYPTGFTGVLDGLGARFESVERDEHGTPTDVLGTIEVDDPQVIARLLGSSGDDRFRVVDGPLGMVVDGADGTDHVVVETNGNDRTVRVTDTGGTGDDTLTVRGTTGPDRILLRALRDPERPLTAAELTELAEDERAEELAWATHGLVAVLSRDSETVVDEHDLGRPNPTENQAEREEEVESLRYTGKADATQLVYYDDSIGTLEVDGVAGENDIALDDVATETVIETGRGTGAGDIGNRIQVGQIFGWYADEIVTDPAGVVAPFRRPLAPNHPVAEEAPEPWTDGFRYRESIRGWLSYGVSHPTTVRGGEANDVFTVYSNVDRLTLEGVAGNNTFTLRAFIENGSIRANGGSGDDTFNYDFEYVDNAKVEIDGGEGMNTFVAIGTELQDGFTVTDEGVSVCVPRTTAPGVSDLDRRVSQYPGVFALPEQPDEASSCGIDTEIERVQRYVLYGLEGNNVFWVRGAPAATATYLIGGLHGSTYLFGDAGDLSAIEGTVEVVADLDNLSANAEEALAAVDLAFPLPVLLHGEVAFSPVAAMIPGDAVDTEAEHLGIVDASTMTEQDGSLVSDVDTVSDEAPGVRLTGLSTGAAGDHETEDGQDYTVAGGVGFRGLDLLRVVLGDGADELHVEDTHGAYRLELDPLTSDGTSPDEDEEPRFSERAGRTELFAGDGDDDLRIGAMSGPTWVWLDAGDNELRIADGDATDLAGALEVYGGTGADDVEVDAGGGSRAGAVGLRADLDLLRDQQRTTSNHAGPRDEEGNLVPEVRDLHLAELTGLEMPALVRPTVPADPDEGDDPAWPATGRVRHDDAVEVFRVVTGDGRDVVNVRGSLASDVTELVTEDADDRVFVSSAAALSPSSPTPGLLPGHLRDVLGDVDLAAGGGDNLLMVSRRSDDDDVEAGRVTPDTLSGFAPGTVTYDADGTFTQGLTVWTGGGADTVEVDGVRRDGDPTTLAWEDRDDSGGPIRTTTTLNLGDGDDDVTVTVGTATDDDPERHGLLVVNLEEGDDRLDGSASTLGFVVFGGDGADRIATGAGDDLVFGDWGRVEFRDGGDLVDVWGVPDAMDLTDGRARAPEVVATCTAQPTVEDGDVAGCDDVASDVGHERVHDGLPVSGIELRNWVSVGDGDDVALGGGGRDWLEATDGVNALVGDHARVWRVTTDSLGGERTVTTNGPFIGELVLDGPFAYRADIRDDLGGEADVILGGVDRDWLWGGLGDDLLNGGDGRDVLWGGDGHDVIWGGRDDDRIYGGAGDDVIDVKLRQDGTWPVEVWTAWAGRPLVPVADWMTVAPSVDTDRDASTDNGHDLVFGGTGADLMQADVGTGGPKPGDRLLDWYGARNAYLVCQGAYGAGYVLRNPSPATVTMLRELATIDGVRGIGTVGSSGERQLAMIDGGERNPPHPLHPANQADCGAGSPSEPDPLAGEAGGTGEEPESDPAPPGDGGGTGDGGGNGDPSTPPGNGRGRGD